MFQAFYGLNLKHLLGESSGIVRPDLKKKQTAERRQPFFGEVKVRRVTSTRWLFSLRSFWPPLAHPQPAVKRPSRRLWRLPDFWRCFIVCRFLRQADAHPVKCRENASLRPFSNLNSTDSEAKQTVKASKSGAKWYFLCWKSDLQPRPLFVSAPLSAGFSGAERRGQEEP